MKVLKKQELITEGIQIGDQININLTGLGQFTATAQKITDKGIVFLFDDCVADRPMNNYYTNKGGYKKSDLCEWINTELLNAFPDEIKSRIINLTIPTYGQMFGHDNLYDNFKPDEDEQFPLMKKRKTRKKGSGNWGCGSVYTYHRVADFKDDYEWYWMQNATKKKVSAGGFAVVGYGGDADCVAASFSFGVRPVFLLA